MLRQVLNKSLINVGRKYQVGKPMKELLMEKSTIEIVTNFGKKTKKIKPPQQDSESMLQMIFGKDVM